jgi:hypothetical protein
VQALHDL